MSTVNLYDVLNVANECTKKEIKNSYRKLVKEFHPDKPNGDAEMFELITHAYNILSNPETRSDYDKFFEMSKQSNDDFFKMKDSAKEFYESQSNKELDDRTKEQKAIDFSKEMDIMDKRHGINNMADYTDKIPLDDIEKRFRDLETLREQQDIEETHEELFDENTPFDINRFNSAFDALYGSNNEIVQHTGNPGAWNTSSFDSSYSNLDNYGDLYADNHGDEYSSVNFTMNTKNKLSKKDIKNLEPANYTKNHNVCDTDYQNSLEKRLMEREYQTDNFDEMTFDDFETDESCGGYGILDGIGIKDMNAISWDNSESLQDRYDKLLERRNN